MIPMNETVRGHDVGDFIDSIWANTLRAPRHSAKPEPRVSPRLGPSGECRLSQDECPRRGKHHWWPHGNILKCMKCNKRIPRENNK